jgi:hypothetical protein
VDVRFFAARGLAPTFFSVQPGPLASRATSAKESQATSYRGKALAPGL